MSSTTCDGRALPFVEIPSKRWEHEVREGLRQSLWCKLLDRRQEFDGIQYGVDRSSSLALLNDKRTDEYNK
eukprot:8267307-Karenia_brevis.AAC.1